jgi:hypothetical protein
VIHDPFSDVWPRPDATALLMETFIPDNSSADEMGLEVIPQHFIYEPNLGPAFHMDQQAAH